MKLNQNILTSLLLLAFVSLGAPDVIAQQITIRTMSLQPIPDVVVYNSSKTFFDQADNNGRVSVTGVEKSDTLHFQHPAFFNLSFTLKELSEKGYTVTMTEKVLVLNEFVVAAAKTKEKADIVSHKVDVISASEIAFSNPPTVAHALENSGKVFVQRSQMGGGSPVIRGLEANKVLLVVDGIRMNNAIYRGEHLQNVITVDDEILDRIEIVQGPGSLIYGSDALGGVIHLYTQKPKLSTDESLFMKGNAMIRYSSANFEKTAHVDVNLGTKKFASLSSVTFTDFDDLRMGSRQNPFYEDYGKRFEYVDRINGVDTVVRNNNPLIQRFTGYWQLDALQKFLVPVKESSLTFNFQLSTSSNVPRYELLRETETIIVTEPSVVDIFEDTVIIVDTTYEIDRLRWAEWYYGPQTRFMAGMEVALNKKTKLYNEGTLIAAYQKVYEERIQRRFGQAEKIFRKENVDIVTVNLDLVKKLDRLNTLQYGFEGTFNNVRSSAEAKDINTRQTQPASTRYPEDGAFMHTYALYIKYKFNISDKVIINSGFRYSHIFLSANFSNNNFFEVNFNDAGSNTAAFSGAFGLIYNPGKSWHFNALLSSGYRSPNLDDAVKISNLETNPQANRVLVPNLKLKPEYVYSIEIGVRKRFYEKVSASLVFFNMLIRDIIQVQPYSINGIDSITYDGEVSSIYANVNIGKAYIRGFTFDLNADITRHLSFTTALTYTFGKNVTDGVPLDHIPPIYGQTSLLTRFGKFKGEIMLRYHGWKHIEDYAPNGDDNLIDATELGAPAWFTLNIRAGYQFNKYFKLQLAVENILDQHYRQFSSGVSAPGINAIVTGRVSF